MTVGNGSSIKVWSDLWLNCCNGFYISSPMVPRFKDIVVSDLIDEHSTQLNYLLLYGIFLPFDVGKILHILIGRFE